MRHDLLAIVLAVMVLPALVGRASGDDAVSAARRAPTVPSSQARPTTGQPPIRTSSTPLSREVLVPFDDLHVLLEGPVRRVMLSREEYETLIEQARQKPDDPAPTSALMTAATYAALLGEERASIGGEITIDVLEEGLHALALDLSGVGLRRAVLDGAEAPLGLAGDGRPVIFVSGVGQHRLDLSLVCPLAADAARQIIDVQIPVAAATRFTLTAPGDVEVDASASSTAVASREVTVDEQDRRSTRFELSVDRSGEVTLVLSLNRRFRAAERLVLARSVSVAEVTESQEKLSSTISLKVLRQPIDRFRFLVPEGFDITAVDGQDLDRWTVENGVLEVQLRQPLTGAVRLGVTAWRVPARLDDWRFPRLRPEEVIGEMAVVGLLLEQTLQAKSVASDGLIPIDTQVLMRAIPGGLARDEEGFEPLAVRLLLASYAPTARYALSARFAKRPSTLLVTSNLLLEVSDANHRVQGGIALRPGGTACYRISLSVPPGWQIEGVTSSDGRVLPFDRFEHRIQIQLPGGVQPDDVASIRFEATATPPGWLDRWSTASVGFPEFAVLEATEHRGAVALRAIDDLMLRPTRLEGLAPLDEHEKAEFGLQDVRSDLAYRVLDRPFVADFQATRGVPRLTARTFSFFRLDPDELTVRAEIAYDIAEARTLSLSFLLPNDTPTALSITGLDGVMVEESRHEPFDEQWRRWTAELTEPRRGPVRLAVDFALRLDLVASGEVALPVIRAEGVAFQSGLVAIEGSESLNVEVTAHPRRVDVGELVDAAYQPGPRLLGVFAFAGDPERLAVRAVRDAERGLPSAIVQEARLVTAMSAEELGQTAARFTLLGAAQYLELELPPGATLWTITVDGQPTKPLRDGTRLLIDLPGPSDRAASLRELSVVYQAPLPRSGLFGTASIAAPQLRFPSGTDGSASDPLPIADLRWDLYLPAGYQVASAGGTVTAALPPPPPLAVVQLGRWLYTAAGGIPGPPWLMPVFARARAPVASRPPAPPAQMGVPERPQADSAVAAAGAPREEAPVDAAKQDHNALRSRARASRSAPAPSPREDLLGLRSLEIDLQPVGEPVRLSSLGVDPTVEIRLANDRRVRFLALSVALLVLWWGLTRAASRPCSIRAARPAAGHAHSDRGAASERDRGRERRVLRRRPARADPHRAAGVRSAPPSAGRATASLGPDCLADPDLWSGDRSGCRRR